MSTTIKNAGVAVPARRMIDLTDAGAALYEQEVLAHWASPAHSIADMETSRVDVANPSYCALRVMQLEIQAAEIEAAVAVLKRAALRFKLPVATIMRDGGRGMRLAAEKLANAA